jgi:hypothetical protein
MAGAKARESITTIPWRLEHDSAGQGQQAPRLLALHAVTVEGYWRLSEQTRLFYERLIGLPRAGLHIEPAGTTLLVFHNDGPDLLVRATNEPTLWANRPRAVIEVPDLRAVRLRLDDQLVPYQPMQRWYGADQRIGLWDPSGNRLEIKRLWPTR